MEIVQKKIAGVDTIFAHLPGSTSTTVEIMVRAGSIYEAAETNGISHFLEHMFFKGGKKYTTPQAVAEVVDAFGGEFNAYTSEEYAGYYVKAAPEYLAAALDVLADMLVDAQFPSAELEREKGVIIQEIKMYEDIPHRHVIDLWKHRYYGENSFGRPILGPIANINAFHQEHFFRHKEALYTKDNLVIVIAGAITDQSAIEEHIAQLFSRLPEKKTIEKPLFVRQLPEMMRQSHDLDTQQNHLIISSAGRDMHDELRYPAGLVANILGGTMSSRLFQEIREKRGLCYYVSATHDSNDQEGVFLIRAGIEKARWQYGLDAIDEQLDQIATGNISESERKKALGNIKGKTQVGLETSDQITSFLGHQWLFDGEIRSLDQILVAYEQVTHDQLKSVARALASAHRYAYRVE